MILLTVLSVLIVITFIILVTKKNLGDSLLLTLTLVLVLFLIPWLILLSISRIVS